MDKYEYNLKFDQIKSLCSEENFDSAAEIADTISWSKVRNVNALVKAGEVYEKVGRYDEAHEILLMAYDRSPIGRMIIYRLAELAIKMNNLDEAQDYYEEFVEIAPRDNLKYVLSYELAKGRGASYPELISILEKYKEQEYTEEWSYELAYLYHKANMSEKCIEACDELILWFGDGPYVERALELKMIYQPLSKIQEDKYRTFRLEKEGITQVDTGLNSRPVAIPPVSLSPERYNTVNLQDEIAKGMQQIIAATEKETVSDTMTNLKKIVGEIPNVNVSEETEAEEILNIETDEEIDGSLKINFQELLDEDLDGQISMVVDEHTQLERQITGQMTIADVLEEWEKTKRAAETAMQEAEARRLESAKAKALHEAEVLMERVTASMAEVEEAVTGTPVVEQPVKTMMPDYEQPAVAAEYDQYSAFSPMEAQYGGINPNEMSLEEQMPMDVFYEEEASEELPEEIYEPKPQEENDGINVAIGLNAGIPIGGSLAAMGAPLAAGMAALGAIATPVEEVAAAVQTAENMMEEPTVVERTVVHAESSTATEVKEDSAVADSYATEEWEIPSEADEMLYEEDIREEALPESSMRELRPMDESFEQTILSQETIRLPEIKEISYPEALLPKVAAEPEAIPAVEIPEMAEELVQEPEASIFEKLADKLEKEAEADVNELTAEQKAIFSYFVPVKGMEDQLCVALRGIHKHLTSGETAGTGNLIITGGRESGKTALATSVVRVIQQETGKLGGKVGKINGEALNRKDVQGLLEKIEGGVLIIERAGEVERETAVKLALLLKNNTSGLLVILEDTTKGIKKALSLDPAFASLFTETIDVPIFTNDELVSFAKSYSEELGYQIDEMAVLALYNRISNIQKIDQATTLAEVKEIVDEAIYREKHSGLKKAFSILTASRYTDDDKIVLKERVFE